ncbi:sulfur carrier protein ThiS [Paenibacillus thermoaerophilus]|uniref:Sulfur carrier protein ThiS n=1 Tax=Paenibacillus thermoaerophilus TaxID=1215385 RepID=A0ABW2V6X4_9BACL|nr:sulfur carrier protein ThiS [Paenibacillus thermoaerophilus]
MRLKVNGEWREVGEVRNVEQLLASFGLQNKILVVELNRTIVERGTYADTALAEGDQVEIVHFVGGG